MPRSHARTIRGAGTVLLAVTLVAGGLALPVAASAMTVTRIGTADDGALRVLLPDAGALWVRATVLSPVDGATLLVTDELHYDNDGGWTTDAPVRLGSAEYGDYPVDVDYRTSAGPVEHWSAAEHPAVARFHYGRHARLVSAAFDRTTTDYDHRTVHLAGSVVAYDPTTGTDVAPSAGTTVRLAYTRSAGTTSTARTASATVGAGGAFSVPVTPGGAIRQASVSIGSPAGGTETAATATTDVPDVGTEATSVRVVGSPAHVRVHAGRTATVSGTVERLTSAGWRPLPGAAVVSRAGGPDPYTYTTSGRIGSGTTNSAGHYSFAVTPPRTVEVATYAVTSDYLTVSAYPSTLLDVPTRGAYSSVAMSIDQYRTVKARGRLRGNCGQQRVVLQYSRTGRSGWTSIGAVTTDYRSGASCPFTVTGDGGVDGYYRLAHSESDAMLTLTSGRKHLGRTQTRITSFSLSPTRPSKNERLTAHGTLGQRIGGHWRGLRAQVGLVYRPKGEREFYLMAKATAASSGRFSISSKAYGDGVWAVFYYADGKHFYSETAVRNVDVR